MIPKNCAAIVRVLCWFSWVFCLISPKSHVSKKLSVPHKFYASGLIAILVYLFQYYLRLKFALLYFRMPTLFAVLDIMDSSIPLLAVILAILYAVFFKRKVFLDICEKFLESDHFLGERVANIKKVTLLLLVEFFFFAAFCLFSIVVLSYLVNQSYGVKIVVQKYNISYCITLSMFLLSIFNVHAFIVLIRTVLSGTNRKLTQNMEGILSFTHYKQFPHFLPKIEIYPYLVQYRTSFELIRSFNEYFGLQLLIITCTSFIVLIENVYLSTLKLKGSAMEIIPPYILFCRHITNTAIYLVSDLFPPKPAHISVSPDSFDAHKQRRPQSPRGNPTRSSSGRQVQSKSGHPRLLEARKSAR